MSVLGVHGILNFKYFKQAGSDLVVAIEEIGADWRTWLASGLRRYAPWAAAPEQVDVAYYADCLARDVGMGSGDPEKLSPLGKELFVYWAEELIQERLGDDWVEQIAQNAMHKWGIRKPAEALIRLYGSQVCDLLARLSADLGSYFGEPDRRMAARIRLAEGVRRYNPQVLIAHSLGSVVAYEALCADQGLGKNIQLMLTLGSPLGVPRVVFERLQPTPCGKGIRPPGIRKWVNIADVGDPVALPPGCLTERFDGIDEDFQISLNVANPHGVKNYLRSRRVAETVGMYPHSQVTIGYSSSVS